MPIDLLAPRNIGRADRTMPPILWRIDSPSEVISQSLESGADWFFLPMTLSSEAIAEIARAMTPAHIVLGMDAADFVSRSTRKLDERLAALGRATCDAVMLQNVSLAEVKEGRTFHRFTQLRDQNRVQLCFVDAQTHADAEWMVRHTPAHGVSTIFGIGDQTARYRLLTEAFEIGTAVFARRPQSPIWSIDPSLTRQTDLSFIAGHSEITSIIEPLPATVEDLRAILNAIRHPLSPALVDSYWNHFREQVSEPQKLRGAHPPDWA